MTPTIPWRVVLTVAVLCGDCADTSARPREPGIPAASRTFTLGPAEAILGDADPESGGGLSGVAAGVLTRGGGVVLANAAEHRLEMVDPGGVRARHVGRRGEGPGEFDVIASMIRLPGDSILVYDSGLARASMFDGSGTLSRSIRFDPPPGLARPGVVGRFADGSFVVRLSRAAPPRWPEGTRGRDTVFLARYSRDGTLISRLGTVPDDERFALTLPVGPARHQLLVAVPFGARTHLRMTGDGLLVSTEPGFAIRRMDPDGRIADFVRRKVEPVPVTAEDARRFVEEQAGRASSATAREMIEARYRATPFARHHAGIGDLRVDSDGTVWVLLAPRPGDAASWEALSPDGRSLGMLEIPAGQRVVDFGAGRVLLARTDPETGLDVVTVVPIVR